MIYLDLNHWVGLAKANSNHRDGARFKDALEACVKAEQAGRARFPISDSIFHEVAKIRQYRQRRDLQEVIERVSRYCVVTARNVIAAHEIETMLDELVGPSSSPVNTMTYLDWGALRAFGLVGGLNVYDEQDRDITEQARMEFPGGPAAFDDLVRDAELQLVRSVLAGPSPAEESELRALGWRPGDESGIGERRAEQEIEQVQRFNDNPQSRKGRLRDAIAAREILIELNEMLSHGLRDRGAELLDVFPEPAVTREAFDAMPSFDVAVSVKTSYHQDPSHRWTVNDIHDIDALGSTVPYCDVVVTDKAVAAHLNRTGVAERLDTVVIASLDELMAHL